MIIRGSDKRDNGRLSGATEHESSHDVCMKEVCKDGIRLGLDDDISESEDTGEICESSTLSMGDGDAEVLELFREFARFLQGDDLVFEIGDERQGTEQHVLTAAAFE